MTPQGWQNISSNRQRTDSRESILDEIKRHYPGVTLESQPGKDVVAYWLDERLVGVGWLDTRQRWSYVILPKVAFGAGVKCSLVPLPGDRLRILPYRAEENPMIQRQIDAIYRRHARVPGQGRLRQMNIYVYQENGGWYVEFELRNGVQKFGPYETYDKANEELPGLTERVQRHISAAVG